MVNLGWEHDWNLDLQSDSLAPLFCALGFAHVTGGLMAVIVSLPRLMVPSSCSRSMGETGCSRGQVRSGTSIWGGSRRVTSISASSAEAVEGEQHWQLL